MSSVIGFPIHSLLNKSPGTDNAGAKRKGGGFQHGVTVLGTIKVFSVDS